MPVLYGTSRPETENRVTDSTNATNPANNLIYDTH
jgi:hypothetical protein